MMNGADTGAPAVFVQMPTMTPKPPTTRYVAVFGSYPTSVPQIAFCPPGIVRPSIKGVWAAARASCAVNVARPATASTAAQTTAATTTRPRGDVWLLCFKSYTRFRTTVNVPVVTGDSCLMGRLSACSSGCISVQKHRSARSIASCEHAERQQIVAALLDQDNEK